MYQFIVATALALLAVAAPVASASDALTVKVFPLTGEIQIHNEFGTPAEFVFYSMMSETSSLHRDDGVWLSIDDTYDVSGNGLIDPLNEWVEFAPVPGDPGRELAEGTAGPGGSLAAVRGFSLGRVLDVGVTAADLLGGPADNVPRVVFRKADETELDIEIENAIAGDFNENQKVDMNDYALWNTFFGRTDVSSYIDGNLNGVIDAADYTIWRDNLGKELPPTLSEPSGLASVAIVPEPASLVLEIGAVAGVCCWMIRRRSTVGPN